MKPRTVTVTLELTTNVIAKVLKQATKFWQDCAQELDPEAKVRQVQVIVIRKNR